MRGAPLSSATGIPRVVYLPTPPERKHVPRVQAYALGKPWQTELYPLHPPASCPPPGVLGCAPKSQTRHDLHSDARPQDRDRARATPERPQDQERFPAGGAIQVRPHTSAQKGRVPTRGFPPCRCQADTPLDRKSTRLNSSHIPLSRMPS